MANLNTTIWFITTYITTHPRQRPLQPLLATFIRLTLILSLKVLNYAKSDHFPVCTTRKINFKIVKSEHITTSYRCFKRFNENAFLNDLSSDLDNFTTTSSNINDDISEWYNIFLKHLDNHAPIKVKRVKPQRLSDWYNQDIETSRKQRDSCKRRLQWTK